MDETSLVKLEGLLEKVYAELRAMNAREFPPGAVSLPTAAKRLDMGLTKLRALIRLGDVQTVTIGSRQYVPDSELRRLSTPAPQLKLTRPTRGRKAKASAKAMADRLRSRQR